MKLYPHQEQIILDMRQALMRHQCVLAQAATGFGKTAVGSFMIQSAVTKGKRTFFVVHRKELIEQTSKTFDRLGIEHGIIQSGKTYYPYLNVNVCSIDTLKKRLDSVEPPDFIIFDEAHHTGSKGWALVHAWAKDAGAYIVGLSATPWRLDKKGLDMYFDVMVNGPSVKWLIANGYLSQYKAYSLNVPDMSGVSTKQGDWDVTEVEAIMKDKALYGCAIDNWKRLANGKKTIAFAPTIETSRELAQLFRECGVNAEHLDGGTKSGTRRDVIRKFSDGSIDIISNVGLFGEGFDLSAIAGRDVPIEAVILYRPTQSLSLHLQQVGRALRPKSTPAIILDHAGNCLRHGLPDGEYEWTLGARKKKKSDSEQTIKVRECPKCHSVFEPADICPACGHVFETKQVERDFYDGDLKELTQEAIDAVKKQKKAELIAAKTFDELVTLGKARNYNHPEYWAKHILEGRSKWRKK